MNKSINEIAIAGCDLHGLTIAILLANAFKGAAIKISIIGKCNSIEENVSLHPDSNVLLDALQIDEKTLLKECDGVFKLGTKYNNLPGLEQESFQMFGTSGGPMELVAFQHYFFKKQLSAKNESFSDYSLSCEMAKSGRFSHPSKENTSIMSTVSYSWSLNTEKLIKLLKGRCDSLNVMFIDSEVEFALREEDSIMGLTLENGSTVKADFYVDIKGKLKNLKDEFVQNSHVEVENRFDSVLSFNKPRTEAYNNYQTTSFENSGWIRKTPLQDKDSYEFTYSSQAQNMSDAQTFLMTSLGLAPSTKFYSRTQQFGYARNVFKGNVIGLGENAYHFETTEVSNLHYTIINTQALIRLFPQEESQVEVVSREYNRKYNLRMENISDYQAAKYLNYSNFRNNTDNKEGEISSLSHKLALFQRSGQLAYSEEEIYPEPYRISAMIGLGIQPESYDSLIERFDFPRLDMRFSEMKKMINHVVSQLPTTEQYTQQFLK